MGEWNGEPFCLVARFKVEGETVFGSINPICHNAHLDMLLLWSAGS